MVNKIKQIDKEFYNKTVDKEHCIDLMPLKDYSGFSVQLIIGKCSACIYDAQLQISNNGKEYVNKGDPIRISKKGGFFIIEDVCLYKFARIKLIRLSGWFELRLAMNCQNK